jgi:hypothetical protein
MGITAFIYNQSVPLLVDQRVAPLNEEHSTASEKTARWVSASLVGLVSLVTMDATVFVLGGASVIAFSWMYRHANMGVNPQGPTSIPSGRSTASVDANLGPLQAGANLGLEGAGVQVAY